MTRLLGTCGPLACSTILLAASTAWAQYGQQQGPYGQNGTYPQQQQQQQQQQPGLEAGGLAPPPPMESDQESAQQEQKLERAEKEDSGRGLEFFWINGEVGVEHIGLQTFKENGLVDSGVVKTTQTGVAFGGGLGVRLLFLSIGARFRMGSFSEWQLWTLGAEVGYRIPIGNLEPYFTLGGGYASLGAFRSDNIGSGLNSANVDITGYYIRGGGGLDYYVTPVFSIGANLTGELIGLSRSGGSGLGFGGTLMAVIGLHF